MEAIKLTGRFTESVQAIAELHSTGQFENSRGELCTVSLELDTSEQTQHEYNVRSSTRAIGRNGGATVVTTTETVETFYSLKTAKRGFNWCLYVAAATEQQERDFKLDY